jgi:transposase
VSTPDDGPERGSRDGAGIPRHDRRCRSLFQLQAVGALLGLTPAQHQSGESNRLGKVSLCGDGMLRSMLYEGAQSMLTRGTKWSWLKAWALRVAKRRGSKKPSLP